MLRTIEGEGEIHGESEGEGDVEEVEEEKEACLASCEEAGENKDGLRSACPLSAGDGERGVEGSEEVREEREGMLEVELWDGVGVRRAGGEGLDADEREDSSWWLYVLLLLLLGEREDRTGEEFRGTASDEGELIPNAFWSFCEITLNRLGMCFWESWRCFSCHTVTPLLVFLLSPSPVRTLLSSEVDLLSSDLNLDSEKSPLEKCPMLMLRTTLDFLEGLCRMCFKTTVFLPQVGGETTSLSAGWLKVKEHLLSSTGKSVVMTPFAW